MTADDFVKIHGYCPTMSPADTNYTADEILMLNNFMPPDARLIQVCLDHVKHHVNYLASKGPIKEELDRT